MTAVFMFMSVVSVLLVIVNISLSVFNYNRLFVSLCLCICVAIDVSVPDGSVKKNFSGEARNRDRSQRASSDPQLKDLCGSHTLEQTVGATDTNTHTHTLRVCLGMSHRVISCK